MSMVRSIWILILLVFLPACGGDRPPRQPEYPLLSARPAFGLEPLPTESEVADDVEVGQPSLFAVPRGEASAAGSREPRMDEWVGIGAQLEVPLPPTGGWIGRRAGPVSLIVFKSTDGAPKAVVYTEMFRPGVSSRPSAEVARFRASVLGIDVQQPLSPMAAARRVEQVATGALEGLELTPEQALRAFGALETRTRGTGFGFTPRRGSFSRVRWAGRLPQSDPRQPLVGRFGVYEGSWASPPPVYPEVERLLDYLDRSAEKANASQDEEPGQEIPTEPEGAPQPTSPSPLPEPEDPSPSPAPSDSYDNAGEDENPPSFPLRPAWLLMGSVSTAGGATGVHIAVLWAESGDPDSVTLREDLARLVEGVRPAQSVDSGTDGVFDENTFGEHAGLRSLVYR